jgi:hypothetical protein
MAAAVRGTELNAKPKDPTGRKVMGHHGLLKPADFGDMDHPNRSGAEKFTRHLEQYRIQLEK